MYGGRYSKDFREDGFLSIRRGFRVREMQSLADKARISGARVRMYWGSRLIVEAKKN
jgi:hypothetical protein